MKKSLSPIILFACLMMSFASVGSCQSAPKPGQTVINPAQVALAKHYRDEDPASERVVRITIAPTTQPTAATRPIVIPFDGRTVEAPAGAAVTFETHDTGKPALSDYQESANATGASIRTDTDKGNFDASAPAAGLGNTEFTGVNGGAKGGASRGTGGKVSSDWLAIVAQVLSGISSGVKLAWILGLCFIAGAGGYVVIERLMHGQTDWELAIGVAVFGVAIIILGTVAEKYPWILAILGLLGIAAMVWYVWRWKVKQSPAAVPASGTTVNP